MTVQWFQDGLKPTGSGEYLVKIYNIYIYTCVSCFDGEIVMSCYVLLNIDLYCGSRV